MLLTRSRSSGFRLLLLAGLSEARSWAPWIGLGFALASALLLPLAGPSMGLLHEGSTQLGQASQTEIRDPQLPLPMLEW